MKSGLAIGYLLIASASIFCVPAFAQGRLDEIEGGAAAAYNQLMTDSIGFRNAVRGIPCYTSVDQRESLMAHRRALYDRAQALAAKYRDYMSEGASYRIERLNTVQQQAAENILDLKPCIPVLPEYRAPLKETLPGTTAPKTDSPIRPR